MTTIIFLAYLTYFFKNDNNKDLLYSDIFPVKYSNTYPGRIVIQVFKTFENEVRTNASSVDTDLGGEDHGYLGLVLTDEEYTRVASNYPFIAPKFPEPLFITRGNVTIDDTNIRNNTSRTRVYTESVER